MDFVPVQTAKAQIPEITQIPVENTPLIPGLKPSRLLDKNAIRTSLKASTIDGVFAAVFSITTSGILLSNFLVELDASPVAFGMLSSMPMLVNLIQPLGAFLSERSTSRFHYSLWTYGPSRLLWLILFIGILGLNWGLINHQQLVGLTLTIVLISHFLGGLGSASWLSWLAMIVPRRLRGRYFGIRNSVGSLTNLICVPLAGLAVSKWTDGTIQGYGVVLFIGILFGVVSLVCQHFKADINPKDQNNFILNSPQQPDNILPQSQESENQFLRIWKDSNFLMFLLYFSLWMFAVNLSGPFFNFYMLNTLDLDVSWVTAYGSLQAGANLLMLILWGKLADRIGNRPILIFIGILVAITPLLWLGINGHHLDIWLWLPLLHIFTGGTWAAIDLCSNNMQLSLAPLKHQSIYFAIAAAVAGAFGGLGTTIGGFIVQFPESGGLFSLFALSTGFRLFSLVPLVFVQEPKH